MNGPWFPAAAWYASAARPLPWRTQPRDPWHVLVSEVMLQQTQVARVEPAFVAWVARWPTPAALAADPPGAAVQAWAGLGYPRRALRLHQAAVAVCERHGGVVPDDHQDLLALPGVGSYTAAAVLAFAYQRRVAVLDTNVRRVLQRYSAGREYPVPATSTADERDTVTRSLPTDPVEAAVSSVAVMELGALVCRARSPLCGRCPLASSCAWLEAGRPASAVGMRRPARYAGSDRQARGRVLQLVRDQESVSLAEVDATWPDVAQRQRAVQSLCADGLVEVVGDTLRLPAG